MEQQEEELLDEEEGVIEEAATEEVVEEQQVEEPQPFRTFKTEEEYQAWRKQELESIQLPKPPENKEEEAVRIFEDDYKPKNWNEFALALINNPVALQKFQERLVPETAQKIQEMSVAERKEMEDINQGFDKEYEDLAKSGKLPGLTTTEGQKINQEISLIGAAYGQTSIKKAYELWSKIPPAHGGGLEYVPPAKQKLNAQKQKSGLVGNSRGDNTTTKKSLKYSDVHKRTLDDIIDDDED